MSTNMKTYGLVPAQVLVSLPEDEPMAPQHQTLVPLVKLPQPEAVPGFVWEPLLVWHDDKVERSWQSVPYVAPPKVWPNAQHFMAEFSLAEMGAIDLVQ